MDSEPGLLVQVKDFLWICPLLAKPNPDEATVQGVYLVAAQVTQSASLSVIFIYLGRVLLVRMLVVVTLYDVSNRCGSHFKSSISCA
jgi:hypothetical protein